MDFAAELQKLLDAAEPPLLDPMTELALAQKETLERIYKNSSGLSLQVEEIYDIIKDADEHAKEVKAAAKRENLLLSALVQMTDLLDVLLHYTRDTGHSEALAAKKEEALDLCGLEPLGFAGERLDPRLHRTAGAEASDTPPETLIRVLESGYMYRGEVVRKASVIISKGAGSI